MRSRSNSLENISEVNSSQVQAQAEQREFKGDKASSQSHLMEPPDNMSTIQKKHKISCYSHGYNKNGDLTEQKTSLGNSRDLSHDDLLLLLSILEGELQVSMNGIAISIETGLMPIQIGKESG